MALVWSEYGLLIVAAGIAGLVAIVLLVRRRSKAERQLLRYCMGDQAQVDRLIALEQKRNPKLSRPKAAVRAAHFYRRDNR